MRKLKSLQEKNLARDRKSGEMIDSLGIESEAKERYRIILEEEILVKEGLRQKIKKEMNLAGRKKFRRQKSSLMVCVICNGQEQSQELK